MSHDTAETPGTKSEQPVAPLCIAAAPPVRSKSRGPLLLVCAWSSPFASVPRWKPLDSHRQPPWKGTRAVRKPARPHSDRTHRTTVPVQPSACRLHRSLGPSAMSVLDTMTREAFIAVFNMHEANLTSMQTALTENLDKIAGTPARHKRSRQHSATANRQHTTAPPLTCCRCASESAHGVFRPHQGTGFHVAAQSGRDHSHTTRLAPAGWRAAVLTHCDCVFLCAVCTYLVFIMQLGFALLEAGSVRAMVSAATGRAAARTEQQRGCSLCLCLCSLFSLSRAHRTPRIF